MTNKNFQHCDRTSLFMTLTLAIALSGCLKTRSQIKDDDRGEIQAQPPARVDDSKAQQYAIEEMKSELSRISGKVEDIEKERREEAESKDRVTRDDLKRLDARLAEFEQAQANIIAEIKRLDAGLSQVDQVDLFEKGKKAYKAGEHEDALKLFAQYLRAPNGKFVEEARFLRGEVYFELQDCRKAVAEYTPFQEKFQASKFAPKAFLRMGLCFEQMGMKNDAKLFFQELVDKYPKSPEAKSAQKKLSSKGASRGKSRGSEALRH